MVALKQLKKKLGIGRIKLYALKDRQDNVISDFKDMVKMAEDFNFKLHRIADK